MTVNSLRRTRGCPVSHTRTIAEHRAAPTEHHALIGAYLLGKPLPGRRHPVKAASREAVARNAAASLTGWRWSGVLGPSQTEACASIHKTQPAHNPNPHFL